MWQIYHTALISLTCLFFSSFVYLCASGLGEAGVFVESLTEERAARTLYRIELLRKVREQVDEFILL